STRTHDDPGPIEADLNVVKPAVPFWIRRVIRQHVVRAVLRDDAIECGRKSVRIDDGEAARLLRERPKAVVLEAQLVLQPSGVEVSQRRVPRITGSQSIQLDALIAEVGQTARIDR